MIFIYKGCAIEKKRQLHSLTGSTTLPLWIFMEIYLTLRYYENCSTRMY